MTATYELNPNFNNAINVFFDGFPGRPVCDKMKGQGFRWHKRDKYWFASQTPKRLRFVQKLCGTVEDPKQDESVVAESETQEKTCENAGAKQRNHDVKVGDIFACSWGYEQTNVDFVQVVELKGKSSAIVRGVHPKVTSERAESGMSSVKTYEITSEILPPVKSVFIDDTENGDLKRIKVENGIPYLRIHDHKWSREPLGQNKHFESWWY